MTNIAAVYKSENRKRNFLCRCFTIFERAALRNQFVLKLHQAWLGRLFKGEVDLAAITAQDSILDIGCGPLPILAQTIAHTTTNHINAIDNDQDAITQARRYLQDHGLDRQVTIIQADAETHPMQAYTVIFIAINAAPIETILQHLTHDCKPGTRIICRSCGTSLTTILNQPPFTQAFTIKTSVRRDITYSLLLEKNHV